MNERSPDPTDDGFVTQKEAIELLRVSQYVFVRLVESGRIGVYSPPVGRPKYVKADVLRLRDESFRPASTP